MAHSRLVGKLLFRLLVLDQLDADHQAALADVADVLQLGHALQAFREALGHHPHVLERLLLVEEPQRGERGGAREWVPRVRMAVEKRAARFVRTEKTLVNRVGRQRRGEREITAAQSFRDAEEIRHHLFLLAREQRSGAPESGRDLVADEEHAVLLAGARDALQVAGRVHDHSGRALDERLDHDRRDLVAPAVDDRLRRHRRCVEAVPRAGRPAIDVRCRHAQAVEEERAEDLVEEIHPADADRAERVAVVRLGERDEPGLARLAALAPMLERHFQSHLDRGRAAVGIEDLGQSGFVRRQAVSRRAPDQFRRQLDRRRRREAEERRVRDVLELQLDRAVDLAPVMPVDVHPQ